MPNNSLKLTLPAVQNARVCILEGIGETDCAVSSGAALLAAVVGAADKAADLMG